MRGAEAHRPLQLVVVVGVEHDQRMQVAVAGVKHVGTGQPELLGQLGDAVQHLAQPLARNGAVHAEVVGQDAPDRGERALAPRPELEPLGLVARQADLDGAAGAHHLRDLLDLRGDLLLGAVALAQQDRRGLQRIAGVDELLDRLGGELVHHLEAGGDDARGDDVGDRLAGLDHRVEGGQHDLRLDRLGQQLDRDLGDRPRAAPRSR